MWITAIFYTTTITFERELGGDPERGERKQP